MSRKVIFTFPVASSTFTKTADKDEIAAFRQKNMLPDRSGELSSHPLNSVVIGEGLVSGVSFAKVWREHPDGIFDVRLLNANNSNHYLSVRGSDKERAIRYFANWMERELGIPSDSIEWRAHSL